MWARATNSGIIWPYTVSSSKGVNNTGRTDESYYCVVDGSEVAGRTFQFSDRVDTSAKPFRHYPAALLGTEDQVQTSGYVEGIIELNDAHNGR